MAMTGAGLAGEPAWPLQLSGAELSALLTALDSPVAPASPIAGLIDTDADAPPAASGVAAPAPEVARALRALAAPRQILLVRQGAEEGSPVLGFLNDGELLVGFDVGEEGCTVAEPCEPARFVQLVCSLADVVEAASGEESLVISRRLLEALVALRLAGLFEAAAGGIDRDGAESALAGVGDGRGDAPELLGALAADGVLTVDGSSVRVNPEWLQSCPFLAVPARFKIEAIELGDLTAGRDRRKQLAILGDAVERVVVLPPPWDAAGRDVLLELQPVTEASVAGAVESLLAPPLAPPLVPTADLEGPLGLRPAGASPDALPEWSLHALEELAAPPAGEALAPSALLDPRATVDVLTWGREGSSPERTVLALDAAGAVEWTLDGSLVRWRALGSGDVLPRVDELICAAGAEEAGTPAGAPLSVELDPLLAAIRTSSSGPLPEELHALVEDPGTRWSAVRAACLANGERRERVLLFAEGPVGGGWHLRPDGDAFAVRPLEPDEVHGELADALTPPAQQHVAVGGENGTG